MSTTLKLNSIISLPVTFSEELKVGSIYTITKNGARIMPIGKPMELCTSLYVYVAKVSVEKLVLEENYTTITFRVVKMFSKEESNVFTDNFIRPTEIK